jgi:nicotinamide phosphoribosyltransferase
VQLNAARTDSLKEPMQSLRLNPVLNTDSYKLTHWWQYPPDTRHIIKSNFAGQVFTLDDVEEVRRVAHAHFSSHPKCFNYDGFKSLYAKHGGYLPLRIRAVKEGTVVKTHNALITIENTDPEFYWLTNWPKRFLSRFAEGRRRSREVLRTDRQAKARLLSRRRTCVD